MNDEVQCAAESDEDVALLSVALDVSSLLPSLQASVQSVQRLEASAAPAESTSNAGGAQAGPSQPAPQQSLESRYGLDPCPDGFRMPLLNVLHLVSPRLTACKHHSMRVVAKLLSQQCCYCLQHIDVNRPKEECETGMRANEKQIWRYNSPQGLFLRGSSPAAFVTLPMMYLWFSSM